MQKRKIARWPSVLKNVADPTNNSGLAAFPRTKPLARTKRAESTVSGRKPAWRSSKTTKRNPFLSFQVTAHTFASSCRQLLGIERSLTTIGEFVLSSAVSIGSTSFAPCDVLHLRCYRDTKVLLLTNDTGVDRETDSQTEADDPSDKKCRC